MNSRLNRCTALFTLTEMHVLFWESKISLVLLGVAFTPMKGERKLLQEIWQKVFGNVIDCRWQPSGDLFGPQWFFVMARPAIIQQDKAVFLCVCDCVSVVLAPLTVLSSEAPQEFQTHRGSRGSAILRDRV